MTSSILRWISLALIVFPAVLRTMVMLAPDPYFGLDPRIVDDVAEGLGPAGMIGLDAMSIAGLLLALIAEMICGRGVNLLLCVLGMLPVVPLFVHGWNDADHARIGSTWLAGIATAIAAAHLAREPAMRQLILSVVVALVIPLVTRGVYQVVVEQPMVFEQYDEMRESILLANGWEPDSANARLYERRLRQREASGWFGLSNVFGGVMAGLATFWISVVLTAARSRLSSGWIGLLALIAAAAMAGVAITFSKGAIGAAALGIILSGLVLAPRRWRRRLGQWAPWLTIVLVLAALLGTMARGALLGSRFSLDGYSLFFRWHYWLGAFQMFMKHPWLGVGPDGFKDAYLLVKPLESPEEVSAPHNVFIAWLATLGVFGIAWIVLMMRLTRTLMIPIIEGREETGDESDQAPDDAPERNADGPSPGRWMLPLGFVVIIFAVTLGLRSATALPDFKFLFWPLALLSFGGLIAVLPWIGQVTMWTRLRWGIWAAITVILVQSQIEMTLTQPGSTPMLLMLLGGSAVIRPRAVSTSMHRLRDGIGVILVAGVLAIVVTGWWMPRARQQGLIAEAASQLHDVGRVRQLSPPRSAASLQEVLSIIEQLRQMSTELAGLGFDPGTEGVLREARSAAQMQQGDRVIPLVGEAWDAVDRSLMRLELERMQQAIETLERAWPYPLDPSRASGSQRRLQADILPLKEMIKLWTDLARMTASTDLVDQDPRSVFDVAEQLCSTLREVRPSEPSSFQLAASVAQSRHELIEDPAALQRAIELQRVAVNLDPYGLPARRKLAQMLETTGDLEASSGAWRRVLEINSTLALDPLKGLTETEVARIERRIQRLEAGERDQ